MPSPGVELLLAPSAKIASVSSSRSPTERSLTLCFVLVVDYEQRLLACTGGTVAIHRYW